MLRFCCAALACALLSLAASAQSGQPDARYLRALAANPQLPVMQYTIDLTHPNNHLANVTLVAPAPHAKTRILIPDWYPGRYSIYNYGANVQQAQAFCAAGGQALPFHRLGPNAWEVENGNCHRLRWQYRVYGNRPLNGSFFQLDATHANLNGGPVYMYLEGDKPNPVTLDIRAPQGWKVLNEVGQLNQTHLWFPNYDIFIDAPTEAAPDFSLDHFQADGKTYRVLIHDYATPTTDQANRAQLLAGLKKLVKTENAVVAPDELDTYTFFFHFDPGSSDGMEHLFGTQIMTPEGLGTAAGLRGALADAAHEFFHQWNIKRIRPLALGPWNYQAPNPTPSLWVGEGFTQYYGEISLERSGLTPAGQYLASLGRSFGSSLYAPGYRLMSAEDSSLTAWFHDATPLRQETNGAITQISYYARGQQIAAVLDLDLREHSAGHKSLNDVLRWLWKNTYHAPRATYYLPGRGYTDLDVEHAIEAVSGTSFAQFFRDYVSGTKVIPYDQYLAGVGLKLACKVPDGTSSYSGVMMAGNRVRGVAPSSPGAAAGLGTDQILVSVNGTPVPAPPAATPGQRRFRFGPSPLASLPAGQPATLVVTAHGKTLTLTLTPTAAEPTSCTLQDLPNATPAQKHLRAGWLAGR